MMTAPTADSIADEVRATFAGEAVELLRNVELALNELPLAEGPARDALWLEMLRALHTLKGAAAVAGEDELSEHVHGLEDQIRTLEKGEEELNPLVMERLSGFLQCIHFIVDHLVETVDGRAAMPSTGKVENRKDAEDAPAAVLMLSAGHSSAGDFLRLRPEKVDALQTLAGELVISRLRYDLVSKRLLDLRDRTAETVGAFRLFGSQSSQSRGQPSAGDWQERSSRIQAFSAALSGLVQELAAVAAELPMLQAQAAAISTSLEDGIRELRLMPLVPFFEQYAKAVRETAREGHKDARLDIRADGAQVDRAVLMKLRDPLLHLVRNAVVHGIEPPDHRVAIGKSAFGTVRLEGRCEGSRAILQVIDDGAGVDIERVRRKARELRLFDASQPLKNEDLIELLIRPGFSTRDRADGLAGRGIGLEVVANAVREIDGHLHVSTTAGGGTVFTIDVPVTASTGAGLVVRVDTHSFGILLHHIERALRVGCEDVVSVQSRDTVLIGDGPVAIVSLASLLGIDSAPIQAPRKPAVLLRLAKQRLLVTLDDIPGEQLLVVRPLSKAFASAEVFSGAAVQPDGTILPVLHVPAIFQRAAAMASDNHTRELGIERARVKEDTSILVVDDSITMRTLLRNILQAAHYTVTVAHDGQAALQVLDGMPACHLLIADLQMPRLDGFDLCRAIRRSSRSNLPIIIVTSVGDASEKRRALEAGADAYIVKADFEQSLFLDLVAKFTGSRGAVA